MGMNVKMINSNFVEEPARGWLGRWIQWSPTSMKFLQEAEQRVMSYLRTPYVGRFVEIGSRVSGGDGVKDVVWTVSLNEVSPSTPLVLVHGFGAGVAFWSLNLDKLAVDRPVHAFDLLGFGRSSRPSFEGDASRAESQLVQSIEDWRAAMGIERFVLLGHSMGGFLAASYAIQHPERVRHLVLADPWGFQGIAAYEEAKLKIPLFAKVVMSLVKPFNPLAGLRVAGPCGPKLVTKLRSDLTEKFSSLVVDMDAIPNYIYHCNAQTPSGESAFKSMTESFGWAKHPMIDRIGELSDDVPITFIYGAHSWMDRRPGYETKNMRRASRVVVHVISDAGHHVYADQVDIFNELVNKACESVSLNRGRDEISASDEDEGIGIEGNSSVSPTSIGSTDPLFEEGSTTI